MYILGFLVSLVVGIWFYLMGTAICASIVMGVYSLFKALFEPDSYE